MSGREGAGRRRWDPRWRRAAALGSVWSATEITLGSFLHNLRAPLSGHLLTGIAVLLLSGAQRRWGGRGVVARAGLVAALMKSVSPSAVLLGPMVAISAEGLSFELGLALGRGGLAGCLIGGALAMSWTFVQMLVSLLLVFGTDLAAAYARLVAVVSETTGPVPLGAVGPLAALALLDVTVGVAAALAGWRAGGSGGESTAEASAVQPLPARSVAAARSVTPRLPILAALLAALPLGLAAASRVPLWAAGALTAAFLAAAALRYGTALRRLARPGLWLGLLAVSGGAGLVLGSASGAPPSAALAIATEMTLRALFVTCCFAAIGVELSHPGLRTWLGEHGGAALLGAVDAAFATLPEVIASLPGPRSLATRPAASLAAVLSRLDARLEGPVPAPRRAAAVVITGERGGGKTTLAVAVVERLRAAGLRVGGVLAPGTFRDGRRFSFDVVDVASGERVPFARRERTEGWLELGVFHVAPGGLAHGRAALSLEGADVMVVDEVGPWELQGSGWCAELDSLARRDVALVLTVRRECLAAVIERWRLSDAVVFEVGDADAARVAEAVSAAR